MEFGESQKAFVEYNQTLPEIDHWLGKVETQTISDQTTRNAELSLQDIVALCVESGSNEEQIHQLSQLNDTHVVCEQDVFQSSIEQLNTLTRRQEEITDWINTRTQSVSRNCVR